MGSGEVGGGGSVKWKVSHHDLNGNPSKRSSKAKQTSVDGDVSVDFEVQGRDRIPFELIGARFQNQGYFKVTLRGHGVFWVKAIDRRNRRKANVPMEIQIEW